jgi:hypothetical protein
MVAGSQTKAADIRTQQHVCWVTAVKSRGFVIKCDMRCANFWCYLVCCGVRLCHEVGDHLHYKFVHRISNTMNAGPCV